MATAAPNTSWHGQAHFHPAIYRAMAGFAGLTALASLVFFADGGPEAYVYVIVAGFILGSLGLPYLIRRARRRDARPWRGSVPPAETGESLSRFASSDFAAGPTRISGREAAIQALLPVAAVGIGMALLAAALMVVTAAPPG